ncbi:MAG: hypothetical protein ACLR8Y_07215 [Alistipes indistinctus]
MLVVTAAAMLVAPLSARGYRKYAGEQPYLCNGSRDSHGNASPAEEIGSIVAATAPTRNPAETSPSLQLPARGLRQAERPGSIRLPSGARRCTNR